MEPEATVVVPVLPSSVEKPVLEPIPQIDSSLLCEQSVLEVTATLAAYNRNLLRLIVYAMELGGYADVSADYRDNIIRILNIND